MKDVIAPGAPGDDLSFREFEHADMLACSRICLGAWPEIANISREEDMLKTMRLYVDFYRCSSTWLEVAHANQRVVGFLFGRIDKEQGIFDRVRSFLGHGGVYLRLSLGRYGRMSNRLKMVQSALADDKNIAKLSPNSDGEVSLFVVDSAFRGRGIGRALMDRFLQRAREADSKMITVYTNDIGCNWGFYERYGFKLLGTFRDSFSSFVRKEEIKALVFGIEL